MQGLERLPLYTGATYTMYGDRKRSHSVQRVLQGVHCLGGTNSNQHAAALTGV